MNERRYKERRAKEAELPSENSQGWHASCMLGTAGFLHRYKGGEKQDKEILIERALAPGTVGIGDTNATNACGRNLSGRVTQGEPVSLF